MRRNDILTKNNLLPIYSKEKLQQLNNELELYIEKTGSDP
jgi:hypothetical protein